MREKIVCPVCGKDIDKDDARECLCEHFPGGNAPPPQYDLALEHYLELKEFAEEGD